MGFLSVIRFLCAMWCANCQQARDTLFDWCTGDHETFGYVRLRSDRFKSVKTAALEQTEVQLVKLVVC